MWGKHGEVHRYTVCLLGCSRKGLSCDSGSTFLWFFLLVLFTGVTILWCPLLCPPLPPCNSHHLVSSFMAAFPHFLHARSPLCAIGMSGIFSPLDAATPAFLTGGTAGKSLVVGGPNLGGRGVPRGAPSMTPSASTPALSGVGLVQPPPSCVAGTLY